MTMRALAHREHGMAVIAALLVVMLATLLVTGLLQRQATELRALENATARAQAQLLMRSGLDWARLVLYSDGRRHAITAGDQLWAVPVEDTRISREDDGRVAVFSGRVYDEQGKFNLANLARDGTLQPAAVAGFARLLGLLGQPEGLAPLIAQRIAVAQLRVNEDGATAPPLAPMPASLDDLLLLDSVTPAVVDALRAHATLLPEPTAVNANTASAEVLAAVVPKLSLAGARAFVTQRDRGVWVLDTADLQNRLAIQDVTLSSAEIVANSDWFLVKGAVTLERAVVGTEALLRRGATPVPEIIWIRELS